MPILGKSVAVVLHTGELHEVNGSALPYQPLSDSHSLEVFPNSLNISYNRYLVSESKQTPRHHRGPYHVSFYMDIFKGNGTLVVSLF